MLYNEFIENVGCRDNEFNYNVYKELEIIYMNTDCSKSHIYEMGKKLVNNEEPDNVKEIKNKICKLKDDLKYNKKLLNDYKNLYKESNDEIWKTYINDYKKFCKEIQNEISKLRWIIMEDSLN